MNELDVIIGSPPNGLFWEKAFCGSPCCCAFDSLQFNSVYIYIEGEQSSSFSSTMATGGINLSAEFFELLKAIGESKSKQEEDRIIAKEVAKLKSKLEAPAAGGTNPLSNKKRAKEFLVRLLYVEMLGHDGSFGYIKAVEMAASASLYHKRCGYLVCISCLPPTHEFRFMLVNQMQRDLHSANVLECSGGLIACTSIITPDMVPAVMTDVTKLLTHESATIRKKSIVCLHKFHQLSPDVVTADDLYTHTRKVLCDKDPAVMGSGLNVIYAMCLIEAQPYKDLVPSLVSILKQIGDHRLPSDYDYHRIPAPWMQLKLIRILGILGQADAAASSGMYEILNETMKKADTGINAGYAIVYECVKCLVQIYPNTALLNAAAEAIARFMDSRSHNLKYLGVTGLALIVERQPQYAAQHQLAVMDCLEDADETLQRKTLDLLYRMTNPVNVEFIAEKLLSFLSNTTDLFLKQQLTERVCSIAERYAPNNAWYIRTITQLLEVAGDMVATSTAQNLMNLIAEGTGESDEDDMLLRQNAVELYVALLRDKPVGTLPRTLIEIMAWCLGEYGYLSVVSSLSDILYNLCNWARIHKSKLIPLTRRFIVSAIMKLIAQAGNCPPIAALVIDDYTKSSDIDLQQRCLEFQAILTNCPQILPAIFPVDASAEDVEVDVHLSFLDGYVSYALQNGAAPYSKPEDDDDDDDDAAYAHTPQDAGFNMTPYDKPTTPGSVLHLGASGIGSAAAGPRLPNTANVPLPPGAHAGEAPPVAAAPPPNHDIGLDVRNVAHVWGKAPAPVPPPVVSSVTPPTTSSWGAPAASSSSTYPPAASSSSSTYTPVAPPPPKTAAQLERERQAAGLFGGVVPGAPPPPVATPTPPVRSVAAPLSHVTAAPTPVAPPAAVVDLLDLGAWDDAPTAASAAPSTSANVSLSDDAFAPQAAAMVETVSADDEDVVAQSNIVPTSAVASSSAAAPAAMMSNDDPFATAGLLGDFSDKPLPTLERTLKFEYNGVPMSPMPIVTAQFGQQWGSCTATSPLSLQSSKVLSLNQFMTMMTQMGAHTIEAIVTTNEGICAGMVGAAAVVLIHGKVTPRTSSSSQLDVTVKGSDARMCAALTMYLQTMLR
jgi:AP-4 complex subunit epsilon-1